MCSSPGLTPLPSACLYANLADEGDGLLRSNMFCQDECLNLVDKCLDLSNYPSLRDQVILGRRVHVLNLITSRFNPYHLTFPHITLHPPIKAKVVCNEITTPDETETRCFKASFNETGLSAPNCKSSVSEVSLTGQ